MPMNKKLGCCTGIGIAACFFIKIFFQQGKPEFTRILLNTGRACSLWQCRSSSCLCPKAVQADYKEQIKDV